MEIPIVVAKNLKNLSESKASPTIFSGKNALYKGIILPFLFMLNLRIQI